MAENVIETSIVMPTYQRPVQLAGTLDSIHRQHPRNCEVIVVEDGDNHDETEVRCRQYGARFFRRTDRSSVSFSNPARVINIGIQRAKGEVLILQHSECLHVTPNLIENLVRPHLESKNLAVLASVMALSPDGREEAWFCHPSESRRPIFFCGSIRREWVEYIRGFDEDYEFYAPEDLDFAERLEQVGVEFVWRDDLLAHHQWHSVERGFQQQVGDELWLKKKGSNPIRNLSREWGRL